MSKHTPGPWHIKPYRNFRKCIWASFETNPYPLAHVPVMGHQKHVDANARLIAAAPELLEALKDLAQSIVWKEFGECRGFSDSMPLPVITSVEKARAAIAKATGEQA